MTARRRRADDDTGGFQLRGVHTDRHGEHLPIPTPLLSAMRCRRCRRRGHVTVTALTDDDELLGWCDLPEALADGLRLPAGRPPKEAGVPRDKAAIDGRAAKDAARKRINRAVDDCLLAAPSLMRWLKDD